MAHHRRRRLGEALDLQARLVPDRQADRPERAGHALLAEPVLGGRDQRRRGFAVERLEHAPLAGARAHMLLDQLVDLGADPADDLAAALGQPELRAGMLEPRVLAGRDQAVDLVLERRDPGRVVLVDLPGEVDEGLAVLLGLDRADGDGALLMARAASGSTRAKRQLSRCRRPSRRHYLLANGSFRKDL